MKPEILHEDKTDEFEKKRPKIVCFIFALYWPVKSVLACGQSSSQWSQKIIQANSCANMQAGIVFSFSR